MGSLASFSDLIGGFKWQPGVTPLSSPLVVLSFAAGYPATAIVLSWILSKARSTPIPLGYLPAAHNAVLCVGSLLMFVGTAHAILLDSQSLYQGSLSWLVCFPPGTTSTGPVFFWSYIYYLSKFYELLDTVILVLRKKELSFLHVYHHSLVLLMCYLWLDQQQSLQVIGQLANTGTHVVMYFYFFLNSLGIRPPWKILVTNIQLLQFSFSFLMLLFIIYAQLTSTTGGCAGMRALAFNSFFNATLLLLFIDFHRRSYSSQQKKRRAKKD